MYTKFTNAVLIWMILLVQKTINGRRCQRTLSTGDIASYCCDNHEDVNGTCVECRDGYISESGETCQPCESGSYGRKCVHSCICSVHKKCDYIHGCVVMKEDATTVRLDSKTEDTYTYHTIETIRSTSIINVGSSSIGLFPFGLSKREVIVYSVGIGGCSIGVLLCIAFFRRHTSRSVGQIVETNEPLPNDSMIINEIPEDRIENLYEMIDESTMELELSSTVNQSEQNLSGGPESDQTNSLSTSSKSSDSNDITSMGNNSYLNPYQHIVSDTDPHVYVSTYKQSEELSNSSSEEKGLTSNHQNLLQELFNDPNQNEDCSTDKGSTRSCESSTSSGVEEKSAYLNPYYSVQKTSENQSLKYMEVKNVISTSFDCKPLK